MKTKTPTRNQGPWNLGAIENGRLVFDWSGKVIARIETQDLSPEVIQARRRIIGAAPELLNAAKRLLLNFKPCDPETQPCHCEDCGLRAAIAKAEGR